MAAPSDTTLSPSEAQQQAAPTFTDHDQTASEENGSLQRSLPTTEDTLLGGTHSPVLANTLTAEHAAAGDDEDGESGQDDSFTNIAPEFEEVEQQPSG